MLKIIEAKSNIGLNGLVEMKIGNGIIFLDLIIFQKLSKIFIPIIPISRNLKQKR